MAGLLFPDQLFHIGVIVEDLAVGMSEWGKVLGVRWREPFSGTSEVHLPDSASEESFAAVFSQDGPLFVELIPSRPGTVWSGLGLHHLGYWSDDVALDAQRLVDAGATLEATMKRGPLVLAAYLWVGSSRIELNSSASKLRLIG